MRKNKKSPLVHWLLVFLVGSLGTLAIVVGIVIFQQKMENRDKNISEIINDIIKKPEATEAEDSIDPFLESDAITVNLLTPNDYSRPGDELKEVNAIVVHYVGNPGTTAAQNRNYFENLKDTHITSASSHYIIGLEGEIIQCVPLTEISYASNNRNYDTIAIECCHPDEEGEFTEATYNSLIRLLAALCNTYDLSPYEGIIRHYDVTGKLCPIYYVKNETAWLMLKDDVKETIDALKAENGTEEKKED